MNIIMTPMLYAAFLLSSISALQQPSSMHAAQLPSANARPLRAAQPNIIMTAPKPISSTLLIGDAGALLCYSLGLSTLRTFGIAAQEALASGFDMSQDLAQMNLHLTVQYINIESSSATALTLAWLVGSSLAGACDYEWFERARDNGVVPSLLRAWAYAAPAAFVAKAIVVAAIILPVGGGIALDAPTAAADLGGMLMAVSLWRTLLLQVVF